MVAGLAAIGKQPRDVARVLLTHAHPDHAGGLAGVLDATGADVAVHSDDAGYARDGAIPQRDRATLLGRLFNRLPGGFTGKPVAETLADDQLLEIVSELATGTRLRLRLGRQGRLAQLGERRLDKPEVIGSSPIPPTLLFAG